MKNTAFSVIACIMLAATPLFVACDKEDNAAGAESNVTVAEKLTFPIDFYVTDANGVKWHFKGRIDIHATHFDYDLTISRDGEEFHLRGRINYKDLNGGGMIGYNATVTDKDGNPVVIDNLEELLQALYEEVCFEANMRTGAKSASQHSVVIESIEGTVTDKDGNPVELENLEELMQALIEHVLNNPTNQQ